MQGTRRTRRNSEERQSSAFVHLHLQMLDAVPPGSNHVTQAHLPYQRLSEYPCLANL